MPPIDDPDTAALEDAEHAETSGICERAAEPDNAGTRTYWKREQRARLSTKQRAGLLASLKGRVGFATGEPLDCASQR